MLQLPSDFLLPDYASNGAGSTIANVPATIAALFDAPFVGLPPLAEPLWRPLQRQGPIRRIVVLIIDALGRALLDQEAAALQLVLQQMEINATITSVFPSTTVNALTCLWTGRAPAEHGLVGLNLFFPEFATVGQMLAFTPRFGRHPDALVEAGLKPEDFLAVPAMAEQLARAGVITYTFKGHDIVNTALSKMHGRGTKENIGSATFSEMLWQMRQILETKQDERLFLSGYWPTIDTTSHIHTMEGEVVAAELEALFHQIEHIFLRPLTPRARSETLFFIVADHGQIAADPDLTVDLTHDAVLRDMLLIRGAGDARIPYLYAKQGKQAAVIDHLNAHYSRAILPVAAAEALALGLFGPEPYAAVTAERLGDIVGLMHAGAFWLADDKDKRMANRFKASHGGLSAAEMRVPWLGMHL